MQIILTFLQIALIFKIGSPAWLTREALPETSEIFGQFYGILYIRVLFITHFVYLKK